MAIAASEGCDARSPKTCTAAESVHFFGRFAGQSVPWGTPPGPAGRKGARGSSMPGRAQATEGGKRLRPGVAGRGGGRGGGRSESGGRGKKRGAPAKKSQRPARPRRDVVT